ncbi:MAG: AarF/UbiB family protein [Myxococcota bacterium]|nr:AarF/UbiB family protein [Myxococcota bacterium]
MTTMVGIAPAGAEEEAETMAKGLPEVSTWRMLSRAALVSAVFVWFVALRLFDLVGLRWLAFALTGQRARYERLTGPVAFRRAFEVLGPTYVKLGQLVASGEALFPERYSEEFRKLLDRVPPFSYDEVERTLEEELDGGAARFARIERAPIAAASIAQVHVAVLDDGEEVVVKVQRPGIGDLAAADIALMRIFARVGHRISLHARRANALAVIEDFESNLVEELDFRNEAERMREFNAVMRAMGTDSVAAPRIEDELSGPRVLTMERFDGWRLDDTESILASEFDAEERLLTGIRAWFQTLICKGFFHGDVHAGNFLLLKDGRIGYLDFGIVGTFTEAQKKNVLEYVLGFQDRDFARVGRAMLAMGVTDESKLDFEEFVGDLTEAYAPLVDGRKMKELIPNMMRVGRKHQLRMPRDLVLVTKQLVYLDRYSRALGGENMNVLTDQRLSNLIMQDMLAAMFAPA